MKDADEQSDEPKCRFDPQQDLARGSFIICKWCLRRAEDVLSDRDKRGCWDKAREAAAYYPDRLYRGGENRAS